MYVFGLVWEVEASAVLSDFDDDPEASEVDEVSFEVLASELEPEADEAVLLSAYFSAPELASVEASFFVVVLLSFPL